MIFAKMIIVDKITRFVHNMHVYRPFRQFSISRSNSTTSLISKLETSLSGSPIIPDSFSIDVIKSDLANLKYKGKIIFQFDSIQDFTHFWTIFAGYNLIHITAVSRPITLAKLHLASLDKIHLEAYYTYFTDDVFSFPGYFYDDLRIYQDCFDYSENILDFNEKLNNLEFRKLFKPFHFSMYMFGLYIVERSMFTRWDFELLFHVPRLSTVELSHFFTNYSDFRVLIESLKVIGELFIKYELRGFSSCFQDEYLNYFGLEKLVSGEYTNLVGNNYIYSVNDYRKLFEKYYFNLISTLESNENLFFS